MKLCCKNETWSSAFHETSLRCGNSKIMAPVLAHSISTGVEAFHHFNEQRIMRHDAAYGPSEISREPPLRLHSSHLADGKPTRTIRVLLSCHFLPNCHQLMPYAPRATRTSTGKIRRVDYTDDFASDSDNDTSPESPSSKRGSDMPGPAKHVGSKQSSVRYVHCWHPRIPLPDLERARADCGMF